MSYTGFARLSVGVGLLLAGAACQTQPPTGDPIRVGLLLSYSGYAAGNSVNSERALRLAIDQANQSGGIGGRPLRVVARDTGSVPALIDQPARELLDAGVATFIGPDTTDLIAQFAQVLRSQEDPDRRERTAILPSLNTSSDSLWKPDWWFVMGPSAVRVACDLVTQLRADGRQNPLLLYNPIGQNSWLSWELGLTYGMPKLVLPTDPIWSEDSLASIVEKLESADAYVLAALPASGSSLIHALVASGKLHDPGRWYLAPALHTPAFLASIPRGALEGAHGVAPGTVGGGRADFEKAFRARWGEKPLDDAYPFFDAGAITALALGRAMARNGVIPAHADLSEHVVAVTSCGVGSGALPADCEAIGWNDVGQGLDSLAAGKEIRYVGLTTPVFDKQGQTPDAHTEWWTITGGAFRGILKSGDCR